MLLVLLEQITRQECLFLGNKRKTRQDNRHFDVQENNSEYVTGIQIIE
jgi:hypothetical protein